MYKFDVRRLINIKVIRMVDCDEIDRLFNILDWVLQL